MTEDIYGISKAAPQLPSRDLLRVPHRGGVLTVGHPPFGRSSYAADVIEMQKLYSHSKELSEISFREPTTSESLSIACYIPKEIVELDGWLNLGRIVKTSVGVFVNPPKDAQGNIITDEKTLESFLNDDKLVNGIWLLENDFGFAPSYTFKHGEQDIETFVRGGLARVIEHAEGKTAEIFRSLASTYSSVNVTGFDLKRKSFLSSTAPVMRVACLHNAWRGRRLEIEGNNATEDYGGYIFGVLNSVANSGNA